MDKVEVEVRQRWAADAALRAEFGDNLLACIAYHKAEARGDFNVYGGGGTFKTSTPVR